MRIVANFQVPLSAGELADQLRKMADTIETKAPKYGKFHRAHEYIGTWSLEER